MENILDATEVLLSMNICKKIKINLLVSDTIIYAISLSHGVSIEGDYLLDLIHVHCLPGSIIYSVVSSSNDESLLTTSSRLPSS